MTYLEIYNLRGTSGTLRAKVAIACVKAAQDILNEDPATTDHVKRVAWANAALAGPDGMAEKMLWGLIGNTTIQANGDSSTDNDVQFVVNGLIATYMNGVS